MAVYQESGLRFEGWFAAEAAPTNRSFGWRQKKI